LNHAREVEKETTKLMSQSLQSVAEKAARAGGEVLLSWVGRVRAREKAPKDLVTEADLEAQDTIESLIRGHFPDHDFLGEEGNTTWPRRSEYRWIVDPLDGTTNFIHGLPLFAVSIGVEHKGQLVAAALFDPKANECFTAQRGSGAYLNGNPIHASSCRDLEEALMVASFPPQVTGDSAEIQRFTNVLVRCRGMRRLGSAALNLAYVAAGRLDGFWATSLKTWDVAAGVLIVREAGGTVTGFDGRPFDLEHPALTAASTESLHRQVLQVLRGSD
jgi:myo-inositol-1(or 4)-monophosphatase